MVSTILVVLVLAAVGLVIQIVTAVVAAGAMLVSAHWIAFMVTGVAAAAVPLVIGLVRQRRRRALERLRMDARAMCASSNIDEISVAAIEGRLRGLGVVPPGLIAEFEALYRGEVARALDDRHLEDKERRRLDLLSRALGLSPSMIQQTELDAFLEVYADAVADRRLTAREEQTLAGLQVALRIPAESIRKQVEELNKLSQERAELLAELAAAKSVVRGDLRPINSSISLRRGEECYFTSQFTELKMRVVQTQVIAGSRFSEKDLVEERSGHIYVTNRRMLLVAGGTTSIALDKILDVKVDVRTQVLSVVVDDRKSAYYLAVPQPFILAAFLNRARDGG